MRGGGFLSKDMFLFFLSLHTQKFNIKTLLYFAAARKQTYSFLAEELFLKEKIFKLERTFLLQTLIPISLNSLKPDGVNL